MTRKILIGFIICFILIAAGTAAVFVQGTGNYPNKENINPNRTLVPQREEIPVRLIVPKLQIDTQIESLGEDATGAMEVPKDVKNVSFYNPGFRPGEKGNAVLAGHFDDVNGNPAVFARLKELDIGDEIITVDGNNIEKKFIVALTETYDSDDFPLELVFGDFPIARLNLVTCTGAFINGSYDRRLVVFTRLP